MRTILPVASGKGGVGKTLLSANLGIALAQAGKAVVLIDLDLGGSNLHTILGIRNRHHGVGHLINGMASSLDELLIETAQERLFFIPGDGLFAGTANLPYYRKIAILRQIEQLTADFVILDLGSGSTYNTIDLFLSSNAGLIVTTPDTTAILNAYSFLKSSVLRMLERTFPSKSREREIVHEFMHTRVEGADRSIQDIVAEIYGHSETSGRTAESALEIFYPRVVMNMGRSAQDIKLGARLRQVAQRNLRQDVEFIAYLPFDELTARSPLERSPTLLKYPQSPYSLAVNNCAARLIHEPVPQIPKLFPDDEDITSLADGFRRGRGTGAHEH